MTADWSCAAMIILIFSPLTAMAFCSHAKILGLDKKDDSEE